MTITGGSSVGRVGAARPARHDLTTKTENHNFFDFEPKEGKVPKSDSSAATSDLRAKLENSNFCFLGVKVREVRKPLKVKKVPISYLNTALWRAIEVILSGYFPFSQLLRLWVRSWESSENAVYAEDLGYMG